MAVTKFGEDLELVKVTLPVPRDNEVLIKTTYAGLCHSDLHQIDGYYDLGGEKKLNFKRQFPFCIGHEIEGEVIAVGQKCPRQSQYWSVLWYISLGRLSKLWRV